MMENRINLVLLLTFLIYNGIFLADKKKGESVVWRMRNNIIQEDDSNQWKKRRNSPLAEISTLGRRLTSTSEPELLLVANEATVMIMASLVPDEIIYNMGDYSKREFDGCLLFGDVSGFTDLCEKYNKSGKGGPSRLTQVLNNYIGAMVQEILSHGGDVLEFSGDAFIALWKVTDHLSMRDAVHEAIDCSLVIQKIYGTYRTDVGVVVRVKLAVACGHLVFSLVGDDENSHYLMTGKPIYDLKDAESRSSAGEIVITARVSHHISAHEYLMDVLPDGQHAKVLGVGPNWRNIQRQFDSKGETYSLPSDNVEEFTASEQSGSISTIAKDTLEDTEIASRIFTDHYALRPAVNYAARQKMQRELRRFIIAPVVRGIDSEEPLEYLTEIRQVAILFVNCKVPHSMSPIEGIDVANDVYITVCNAVKNKFGCVNKINNFDKDLMVLVIFGLRGFKDEMESQIALKCAKEVQEKIKNMKFIQGVACAVTTGKCYCGAFGHTLRREYTVIGLVVNKAARLMMAYPDKVTCDRETFLHSKLEARNFVLQEHKHLKGIVNPGPIYQFREVERTYDFGVNISNRPLLGREQEIDLFLSLVKNAKKHTKKDASTSNKINLLMIEGDYRQGKTRLLEEMLFITETDTPINTIPLKKTDLVPYKTIQFIFRYFIGLPSKTTREERENNIRSHYKSIYGEDDFVYLNEVFAVNFAGAPSSNPEIKFKMVEELFTRLSTQIFGDGQTNLPALMRVNSLKLQFAYCEGRLTRDCRVSLLIYPLCTLQDSYWLQSAFFNKIRSRTENCRKYMLNLLQCFEKFWIIAIDEAEFIDDESWMLLQVLLDLNRVFIVASMSIERELTTYAIEALKHRKVKLINLKPIDKWYHVGLACQMLEIEGIPPELEKAIQLRSNGNPGWIESFLVTVMQSGGLYIQKMKRIKAYNKGLVIAPLYMLMRMSTEETKIWMEIMEERTFENEDASKRWKLFHDSCRESYQDITISKKFEEQLKHNKTISICLMNSKFNLDDVEPGYYFDVVILKIFDSLTSYEQLLLKCSSILGDIFPRDMLLYIMSSSAIRITALAVKKLFEIQVLSCAKGNFIEGGLNFNYRLVNPNEDMSVKCNCIGLIVDETCMDLPKYASCGYLRFRSSEFRETTYNLLTDNQKREFHERAIRYLEKETRRCRACGNGYFARRMGDTKIDESLRSSKVRKASAPQLADIDFETRSLGKMFRRMSHSSFGSLNSSAKSKDYSKYRDTAYSISSSLTYSDNISSETTENNLIPSDKLGFTTIRKLKDNFNLARTFSSTDYSQCTCLLVLSSMYSKIIEHCKGAGLAEKVMNYTIEYSYVCIENRNAPQAIKVLEEALQLLEGPMKDQIELEWMVELKRGKLFALLGQARLQLKDDDAVVYFLNALKCYGLNFPKGDIKRKLLKSRFKFRQQIKLYLCSSFFSFSGDTDVAEYCNNVSECLSFLCQYFMGKNMWQEAELAAIWSLNKAVRTETDFEKLCIAYSNMLLVALTTRQRKFCTALEVYALKMCHRKKSNVELEELKAVTYLYYCIARSRNLKDPIDKVMHMSYLVWRVSTASQNYMVLLNTLPFLTHITLLKNQIQEVGNILQEISYLSDLDMDNSEKTWYYALCMMLHLETGLIAEPIAKCHKYIQGQGLDVAVFRDSQCKQRLIVVIWLWEVRNENWEAALCWERLAWDFTLKDYGAGETLQNLFTALYLLEGLLIYMVNKLDMKNLKALAIAEELILTLFKKLEKESTYCICLAARLYHLKAYYMVAKDTDLKTGLKFLRKATRAAEKHKNDLEIIWIRHNELKITTAKLL